MIRPGDSEFSGAPRVGQARGSSQASRARSSCSARSLRSWLVRSMRRFTAASSASVTPGARASSSMCQRSKLARCWRATSVEPIGRRRPAVASESRRPLAGCVQVPGEGQPVVQFDDCVGGEHSEESLAPGCRLELQASMVELSSPVSPSREPLCQGGWGAAGDCARETRAGDESRGRWRTQPSDFSALPAMKRGRTFCASARNGREADPADAGKASRCGLAAGGA